MTMCLFFFVSKIGENANKIIFWLGSQADLMDPHPFRDFCKIPLYFFVLSNRCIPTFSLSRLNFLSLFHSDFSNKRRICVCDIIIFTGLKDDILNTTEPKNEKMAANVVPGFWVTYNKTLGCLVTPFLPPPYKISSIRELQKMVKNCSPPLDIWPEYIVERRGDVNM